MDNRLPSAKDQSKLGRRTFIGGTVAATLAATALGQTRDYSQNAPPVRYPDKDIVVLDPRFDKYKIGNAAIQRLIPECCGRKDQRGTVLVVTWFGVIFPTTSSSVAGRRQSRQRV